MAVDQCLISSGFSRVTACHNPFLLPKPFFLTNLSSFGSNYLRSALKDDSGLVKETLCRWMFTTGNRDFRLVSMQGFDISFFLS